MPKYEAEIEIPMSGDKLEDFIEGLRALGHPKIIFRVEGENRSQVCRDVANELSVFWPTYDEEWWYERLHAIRGHRAQQEI